MQLLQIKIIKITSCIRAIIFTILIISTISIGFTTSVAAADPSISSVNIPDPSLVGTERAEIHVSGVVDTGIYYDHKLILYEKDCTIGICNKNKVKSVEFSPSSSNFDYSFEFNVPNDEYDEDHEYVVELVQDYKLSLGDTRAKSGEYNKFVSAPDSEDPDPQIIDTDDRRVPDTYIYYYADDFSDYGTYDINNPPTIHPGETVDIHFNVRNEGGTAGEFSALQMQFPSFNKENDRSKFEIQSGGFSQNLHLIAPDDTVYDQDGDPHQGGANSWQFERSLDSVISGSEYGFTAEVTPEEPGEFRVLMRATYTDDTAQTGAQNQDSTVGSVPDPDQNGYQMKEVVFDVEPRNEDPNADAGGPYDVGESDSITLDGSGSTDPDGSIQSKSWEVISGDGYISNSKYNAPDNILNDKKSTLELTVTDNNGATATDTAQVNIRNNQPPTAEANGGYTVGEDGSVQLDPSGSTDGDGSITSKSWSVIDGPGSISATQYQAPTDITQNREATVKLTVIDDDGDSASDTATISITDNNQQPTAEANGGYTVGEGGLVQLDSSGSNDGDGNIASKTWLVIDGPGSVSGSEYQAPPDITQDRKATVKLIITDNDGDSASDTATIEINDQPIPSEFVVTILSINTPITAGETLEVAGRVENTGEKIATKNVELAVPDIGSDSTRVRLASGESQDVTLSVGTSAGDAGNPTAEVRSPDDLATSKLTINEQPNSANFAVSIQSTNAPITAGETLKVIANVENTGDQEGTQDIILEADGSQVDTEDALTLAGGSSQTLELTYSTNTDDTPSVDLSLFSNDVSISETVSVETSSTASASLNTEDTTTQPGSEQRIEFDLENTGQQDSGYILKLDIPNELTVLDQSGDGGTWKETNQRWVWTTIGQNEQVTPAVTIAVPDDADGDYSISGEVITNEATVAEATSTLTIQLTGEQTIQNAIDANGNNKIDDIEVLQAIEYWRNNEVVPNTNNKRISDTDILELIEMWRNSTEVNNS